MSMSSKTQFRIRMALYAVILIVAELLQTSVFGTMSLGLVPSVMPVAVACISVCEGSERGSIFGLAGGCLWAWSTRLTFYGAWCILLLTATGILGGLITERYLLQGIKTALSISAGALFLTDGLYTIYGIFSGSIPPYVFFTVFIPEALIALVLCLVIYPISTHISRIGGFHG